MTRLLLARHAETDWNRVRRIQGGGSDTPLNEIGLKQVACLSARLAKEKIDAIYSSPLLRARVTAETIAGAHGLPVIIESDLREVDVGELEGKSINDIGANLGHYLLRTENGEHVALPGGESLTHLKRRVWHTVEKIHRAHPDGTALVVSHYFVTLIIITATLDLPEADIQKFRLNTGSLSLVELSADRQRLVLFNESCFQIGSEPW